ncbi:MAG: hypothetical protein JW955_20430 [Sedimentisphaerales bacterium]|nr:hypothetical protein [Sedimentisphaerales bacterium]
MTEPSIDMTLWPDHEADADLLGFSHFADAIVSCMAPGRLLPATIGVFGDWGSGKSTLLNMVESRLSSAEGTLVLRFNGWLFEGYDDAKAALMEAIVEGVQGRVELTEKAKSLVSSLFRRINWFRVAGTVAKYGTALALGGPPAAGVLLAADASKVVANAEGQNLLKDDGAEASGSPSLPFQNVRSFRSEFSSLLQETSLSRVVVIIDDLDRCLPDTIIETLEAIKLFLFTDNTAYVIAADERLVKYAVRARFPELPGDRAEVGRDYLEKLVQFPVRIPQLSAAEMESYISLLFVEACTDKIADAQGWVQDTKRILEGQSFDRAAAEALVGDVSPELEEGLTIANRLGRLLAMGLNGNPRQCKRFLNTLVMRMCMARARELPLRAQVLAKLMLLEYFRPESFRTLAELQAGQQGTPHELARLEDASKPSAEPEADDESEEASEGESQPRLAPQVAAWLEDSFIQEWLQIEPGLANVDLRPYFYFSRDTLSTTGAVVVRLSAPAQDCLRKLVSGSEAVRSNGLSDVKQLSTGDAAAIFEELAARARREENPSLPNSAFNALVRLSEARPELLGQLFQVLDRTPEPAVPFQIVPVLVRLARGGPFAGSLQALLDRWKGSSANLQLKAAAASALNPPRKKGT